MWSFTNHLLVVLGFGLSLLFLFQVLLSRRPIGSIFAWMLLIIFVPYIGVPLYLMFGGRKMARLISRKGVLYQRPDGGEFDFRRRVERLLSASGAPGPTIGNRVKVLGEGQLAYREFCEEIERAKNSIDIATFILGPDFVGNDILERLMVKAEQGVKVRLLLDAFGSFRADRKRLARFREKGGHLAFFMPMIHIPFRGYSNLRNHRKIAVFDHETAIVGGMNLSGDYMGPQPDPKRFLDLALRIEGPAVWDIAEIFVSDWVFAAPKTEKQLPEDDKESPWASFSGAGVKAQVVASGPDVSGDPLYDAFLSEVFTAEKRIWLATPYFIPDEALSKGLELAARRGVDVRIIVPRVSNHGLADLARGTVLRELQGAGATIHLYQPGMMHAKVTVIDDDTAIVASANLDMRSLFLNYEIAVFLYSGEVLGEVSRWLEALMEKSRVSVPEVKRYREVLEGVARLVSPLL